MPTKKQLEERLADLHLEVGILEEARIIDDAQHEELIANATKENNDLKKELARVNDNLLMLSRRKDEVVVSHFDANARIDQLMVALQAQTTMGRGDSSGKGS